MVIGGPPGRPQRSLDLDPEQDRRYQAAERAQESYITDKATVEALAIPTLTQSVFLNFLGFDGTQPMARDALAGT